MAVVGEVYEPGTFAFGETTSRKSYIEMAGGMTAYALKKNVYVLKPNGSVKFESGSRILKIHLLRSRWRGVIEAGDVIVVPADLRLPTATHKNQFITSVLFQSFKYRRPDHYRTVTI